MLFGGLTSVHWTTTLFIALLGRALDAMEFKVACIQNIAGPDLDANIERCESMIRSAAADGATFIATPEFFASLDVGDSGLDTGTLAEAGHPAITKLGAVAKELGISLLLGSVAVTTGPDKAANRSILVNATGEIAARYDKIHMFDVNLASGEVYRESDLFTPGEQAVVADIPECRLGLTVCYDLRFAYLYRALAHAGAQVLTVPAAFARRTGEAHWHVLLQARAIETGCWVVAPCQAGEHGKFKTFGHSLVVAPWGEIIADGGTDEGVVVATIDLDAVDSARHRIPALTHDREFNVVDPEGKNLRVSVA